MIRRIASFKAFPSPQHSAALILHLLLGLCFPFHHHKKKKNQGEIPEPGSPNHPNLPNLYQKSSKLCNLNYLKLWHFTLHFGQGLLKCLSLAIEHFNRFLMLSNVRCILQNLVHKFLQGERHTSNKEKTCEDSRSLAIR